MIASQRLASRVAVAFAIVACTREARADDSAAAQALFDQAKKAMTAHDYTSACPKLEESYRLEQGLGTLLNLADCYEHEDKLASAWSKFLEVATLARSAGNTARAQIGKQRAAALRPRVSSLVVTASATPAAGLEVKRDGTVLGEAEWGTPIPADAGPHLFEATAPGRRPWSTTVNVEDGGSTLTVRVPDLDLVARRTRPRRGASVARGSGPTGHAATCQRAPGHATRARHRERWPGRRGDWRGSLLRYPVNVEAQRGGEGVPADRVPAPRPAERVEPLERRAYGRQCLDGRLRGGGNRRGRNGGALVHRPDWPRRQRRPGGTGNRLGTASRGVVRP